MPKLLSTLYLALLSGLAHGGEQIFQSRFDEPAEGPYSEREASRFLEPVFERGESSSELLRVGGASHPPVVRIVSAFPPVEVEAEEGKLPAAFAFPPVEFHQRALLIGELQSKLGQSFGQCPQIGLGIVLSLETDDAVIRITPEQHASLAFLGDVFLDPQILDEVKIDVS